MALLLRIGLVGLIISAIFMLLALLGYFLPWQFGFAIYLLPLALINDVLSGLFKGMDRSGTDVLSAFLYLIIFILNASPLGPSLAYLGFQDPAIISGAMLLFLWHFIFSWILPYAIVFIRDRKRFDQLVESAHRDHRA